MPTLHSRWSESLLHFFFFNEFVSLLVCIAYLLFLFIILERQWPCFFQDFWKAMSLPLAGKYHFCGCFTVYYFSPPLNHQVLQSDWTISPKILDVLGLQLLKLVSCQVDRCFNFWLITLLNSCFRHIFKLNTPNSLIPFLDLAVKIVHF